MQDSAQYLKTFVAVTAELGHAHVIAMNPGFLTIPRIFRRRSADYGLLSVSLFTSKHDQH